MWSEPTERPWSSGWPRLGVTLARDKPTLPALDDRHRRAIAAYDRSHRRQRLAGYTFGRAETVRGLRRPGTA